VVTIRGEIDVVNVDRASEYIRRFILANSPVVLDMSDVSHFAAAGIALLSTFDDECRAAGVEWTLVASPAVLDLLDQCEQDEVLFPVRYSVQEALRDLANAIVIRRQLVLPLTKKTA
jgi:anti-anti-sigma factor